MSTTGLAWFKSGYSGAQGDDCVEVAVTQQAEKSLTSRRPLQNITFALALDWPGSGQVTVQRKGGDPGFVRLDPDIRHDTDSLFDVAGPAGIPTAEWNRLVREAMATDLDERQAQTREAILLFAEYARRLYGPEHQAYLAIQSGTNSLKIATTTREAERAPAALSVQLIRLLGRSSLRGCRSRPRRSCRSADTAPRLSGRRLETRCRVGAVSLSVCQSVSCPVARTA